MATRLAAEQPNVTLWAYGGGWCNAVLVCFAASDACAKSLGRHTSSSMRVQTFTVRHDPPVD